MLEGVVLAGGFGTRLRQVVPDFPKPMAPIAGRPFLEILLSDLAAKGFGRIVLSLGFMANKIQEHFGNQYADMELGYVVENEPLGTGGAVRLAMDQTYQDHVYVFNGDTYLDLEISLVEKQWQAHRGAIIIGKEVPDTARYGRLLIKDHRVIGFAEKGIAGPGFINAGTYVLNKGQLDKFNLLSTFSLESDYLSPAVCDSPFDLFVTEGHFIDIGVPEDYLRAQTELAGR